MPIPSSTSLLPMPRKSGGVISAKPDQGSTKARQDAKPRPECDVCGKSFVDRSALRKHERTHSGYRPYPCTHCPARFARRDHLTKHLRTHTGEKPFECDLCHKRFRQKSTLTTHRRTHTGDRPFACKVCGAAFAQKSNYSRHVRQRHPDRENYNILAPFPSEPPQLAALATEAIPAKAHLKLTPDLSPAPVDTEAISLSKSDLLGQNQDTAPVDSSIRDVTDSVLGSLPDDAPSLDLKFSNSMVTNAPSDEVGPSISQS